MIITPTPEDPSEWEVNFDNESLDLGKELSREKRVKALKIFDDYDEKSVQAVVRDFEGYDNEIWIQIEKLDRDFVDLITECSCFEDCASDEEDNDLCPHVVAVIESALKKDPHLFLFKKFELETNPISLVKDEESEVREACLDWLETLEKATQEPASLAIKRQRKRNQLLYAIRGRSDHVELVAYSAYVLSTGGFSNVKPYLFKNMINTPNPAVFLEPEDIQIARKLYLNFALDDDESVQLIGDWGSQLLKEIIATERCFPEKVLKESKPFMASEPMQGELAWELDADGNQNTVIKLPDPDAQFLRLSPPWYMNTATRTIGIVKTRFDGQIIDAWLSAPTLPPEQIEFLQRNFQQTHPQIQFPTPSSVDVEIIRDLKPKPSLKLFSAKLKSIFSSYSWFNGGFEEPEVNLIEFTFHYGDVQIHSTEPESVIKSTRDGKCIRIMRDAESEQRAAARLHKIGFEPAELTHSGYKLSEELAQCFSLPDELDWFAFVENLLPRLEKEDWEIIVDPSFRYNIVTPDHWYADAEEGSGIDWFGVELGVQIEGKKVNLLPLLLELLNKHPDLMKPGALDQIDESEKIKFYLEDGRLLLFPPDPIEGHARIATGSICSFKT